MFTNCVSQEFRQAQWGWPIFAPGCLGLELGRVRGLEKSQMAEPESFGVSSFTELALDLVQLRLWTDVPNQHNPYRILGLKIFFFPFGIWNHSMGIPNLETNDFSFIFLFLFFFSIFSCNFCILIFFNFWNLHWLYNAFLTWSNSCTFPL